MSPGPYDEPPESDHDVAMQEYLRSLDLQRINLDDIDLDESTAGATHAGNSWPRWVMAVALWGLLAWLPGTNYYQLHGEGWWLAGLAAAAAWVTGIGGVQQLLQAVARMTGQPAASVRRLSVPNFTIPPSVLRWGLLIVGLTLGGVVLFALPREAEWQGHGYSWRWFAGVAVAITAGILLGRWLIMQADAKRPPSGPKVRVVLPSWLKWVTLSCLVAAGLFASFGHHLLSGDAGSNSFALGGVGFLVGILGAIWLARRFDEVEAQIRAEKRREQPKN